MNRDSTRPEQPGTKLIDDYLRRELRIADPRNPTELVRALQQRYPAAASRIEQEASGLPVRFDAGTTVPDAIVSARDTPGSREAQRVQDNLAKDLAALIDGPGNREWRPELSGWRDTLLREYGEGMAAARLARDPAQRERSFLAVRRLGEYARLARLIGLMNLPMNAEYRRLATTLDDAANVLRMLMGEALYDGGLAEGGLIIQVPLTDLRLRRDVLLIGVRRLSGLADGDEDDWGDSLAAYRALLAALDAQGAPELRVYLREELLTPILDGLVSSVTRQDPEALRQIAATAPVEISRMRRLLQITNDLVATMPPPPNPIAAALSYFLQALQLFVDMFLQLRANARLIDLAVPLPLAAQQSREADGAGRTIMRDVVSRRADFAREIECYLSCCGGGVEELRCQVKLDKVLYDVDRAIDLYAQGSGLPPNWGGEERRAGVYGVIARNMANDQLCVPSGAVYPVLAAAARAGIDMVAAVADLAAVATLPLRQQEAVAVGRVLSAALAAADASFISRSVGEGILRQLTLPAVPLATVVTLTGPGAGTQRTQLDDLVTAARDLPVTVEAAIQIALNVAETAAGDSMVAAISGITPMPAGTSLAIHMRVAAPVLGAPIEAVTAITASQNAIQAALRVAESQTQPLRDTAAAAGTAAEANSAAAEAALLLLDPNLFVLQRAALGTAAAAAAGAAAVARAAATLQAPGIQTIDLWRTLDGLGTLLQTALPPSGSPEHQQVLTAVFEEQSRSEEDWALLVGALAPRCLSPGRAELVTAASELLHGSHPDYRIRKPRPIVVSMPPPPERITQLQQARDLGQLRRRADQLGLVVEGAFVIVPGLVGRPIAEARQLLGAVKLRAAPRDDKASKQPPGTVVDQNPPAGVTERVGTAVRLYVAVGVQVPDVVGQKARKAAATLATSQLRIGKIIPTTSAKAAGTVLDQNPRAPKQVALETRVDLVVAAGRDSVAVPNVVDRTTKEAESILADSGLARGNVKYKHSNTPDVVLAQHPEPGEPVRRGTAVHLLVGARADTTPRGEEKGVEAERPEEEILDRLSTEEDVQDRLSPEEDFRDRLSREEDVQDRLSREEDFRDRRRLDEDIRDRLRELMDVAERALREIGGTRSLPAKRSVWEGYKRRLRSAWEIMEAEQEAIFRAGGDYALSRFDDLVSPMPEDARAEFVEEKTRQLQECRNILSRYSPRGE